MSEPSEGAIYDLFEIAKLPKAGPCVRERHARDILRNRFSNMAHLSTRREFSFAILHDIATSLAANAVDRRVDQAQTLAAQQTTK